LDIEKHQFGPLATNESERGLAVAGLADDLDRRPREQKTA
jgi:hypothetical protein